MSILFKILKLIGLLLLLALVALASYPWFPVLTEKMSAGRYVNYLEENSTVLDLSAQDATFSFDEDFYASKFFMLGEMHGYEMVQRLDLALLTHLNKTIGTRIYLAEIDPATALAFNHFLETGDDTLMLEVFTLWHDSGASQWGNKDFLQKISAIRRLNDTLPAEKKIAFIGVDALLDPDITQKAKALPAASDPEIYNFNHRLLTAAEERNETRRYRNILPNVAMIQEAFPDETFYGLWGFYHIQKAGANGGRTLASHLNAEDNPWAGSVATISTVCVSNCSNMMPAKAMPGFFQPENGELYINLPMSFDATYLARLRGVGALMSAAGDHEAVLFDLNNDGTPYLEGRQLVSMTGYLFTIQDLSIHGAAAEASDAVILMRGSPPLRPLLSEAYTP